MNRLAPSWTVGQEVRVDRRTSLLRDSHCRVTHTLPDPIARPESGLARHPNWRIGERTEACHTSLRDSADFPKALIFVCSEAVTR